MRRNNLLFIILLCLLLTASIGSAVALYVMSDRSAPVITVDGEKLARIITDGDNSEILKCAKAVDDKDGDVSASLIVENIIYSSDSTSVYYAARDSKDNVATIRYKINVVVESMLGAGERDNQTQKQTEAETVTEAATTEAATTASSNPVFTLNKSEDTLSIGSSFVVSRYIDDIVDDKDTLSDLAKNIIVDGDYNMASAGTYNLQIYCKDSDGNKSNVVSFKLIVK